MNTETNGIERLSKRLSLMALVDPEGFEKIAAMLQYDVKDFRSDIATLEAQTVWQEDSDEASKWHAKGREFFNAQQDKEAFLCFCKGAENGSREDWFIIGCCFAEGRGTKQNDETALRCYQKAADKGSADAMYHLGLCYEQGIGTERDFEKAQYWFNQAISADYQPKIAPVSFNAGQNEPSDPLRATEEQVAEATDQGEQTRPEPDPMQKKAAKLLDAMGVHLSDEDLNQLNDAVKTNKPFPEMVRDFSSMIYKDNPQMKGAFDAVSDETIASWKDMIENLIKGGGK